jgi:starvation-inducible DNA-binding protein
MQEEKAKIRIGIEKREEICKILHSLLASSYMLYLKTQNFHWNVTGPHFAPLHALFQAQYEDLAEAIDEMAERIRALGFFPEGSFEVFGKLSILKEAKGSPPAAMEMVKKLLHDHEEVISFLRDHLREVENLSDGATADFINKRLATHEKFAWMLRSILND